MSSWKGSSNPGHKRRIALWKQIETEFGEPVANVIHGLRHQDGGNSWRTVAGVLGISLDTLLEWRYTLGLKIDLHAKIFDPVSMPRETPTDKKAQALGYKNAQDAVLDLRLKQHKTIREIAKIIGIHYVTVTRYTPPQIRGSIYNRSEYWWTVRRAQCAKMNKEQDRSRHPFRIANNLHFESK